MESTVIPLQPRTRTAREPKPDWLKVRFPAGDRYQRIKSLLREHELHTVCEEARCPNIGECFNSGTATFMILGDVCTRACGFCAVTSGRPEVTAQNPQARVQTSPRIMKVAVPAFQHSPMFGQWASSQIVLRFCSRMRDLRCW